MEHHETVGAWGGRRTGTGRPPGTKTTETSTLVARLKKKTGLTFEDLAPLIGAREKTVRRYVEGSIIPSKGEKRELLEKLAKQHGEPVLDTTQGAA